MTRRFPLRGAQTGAAGDWRQTIVMPPPASAPAPGSGPDTGCGVASIRGAASSAAYRDACEYLFWLVGVDPTRIFARWTVSVAPEYLDYLQLEARRSIPRQAIEDDLAGLGFGELGAAILLWSSSGLGWCAGDIGPIVLRADLFDAVVGDFTGDALTLDLTQYVSCGCW